MQIKIKVLFSLGLLCIVSMLHAQDANKLTPVVLNVQNERPIIESRNALYAKYLLDGDSISIAALYASDGKMGCKKGAGILSAVGSWIRSSIKNDSRHLSFKTITLNSDDDLLIETGLAKAKNDIGELKYSFRYLVVWKKENGVWKLYRDVSL